MSGSSVLGREVDANREKEIKNEKRLAELGGGKKEDKEMRKKLRRREERFVGKRRERELYNVVSRPSMPLGGEIAGNRRE